jgi:hypothetical protein
MGPGVSSSASFFGDYDQTLVTTIDPGILAKKKRLPGSSAGVAPWRQQSIFRNAALLHEKIDQFLDLETIPDISKDACIYPEDLCARRKFDTILLNMRRAFCSQLR